MRCCYLSDPFTCTHSYTVGVRLIAFNLCLHLCDLERLCKGASPPGPSLVAHAFMCWLKWIWLWMHCPNMANLSICCLVGCFVYNETYVASYYSLFCIHTCRGINFTSFWTHAEMRRLVSQLTDISCLVRRHIVPLCTLYHVFLFKD